MSFELVVRPAERWPDEVADRLVAEVAAHPSLRLCLPTGATPRPLYARLVAREVDLSQAHLFLLDEFGGLPPGDPARCDSMLRSDLLEQLPRPPARLTRLDPDLPEPGSAIDAFDAAVAQGGLDLTLVGLGANGHVALNEPGTAPTAPTRRVELHPTTVEGARGYGASVGPSWGLTLGMREILASRALWLLVTGAHKATMLHRTLRGELDASVPASWLREHGQLVVFADEEAAALLG